VLVLDLNMPGAPSLPAIPELAQQTAVVVFTMQADPAFAREELQSGALGYVQGGGHAIQQKTRRTMRAELMRYALDHGLIG